MPRRITRTLARGLAMAAALGASLPAWAQGTTARVSASTGGVQGNRGSIGTALSADGRFAAFESGASNLVSDDTNGRSDVFVHDRRTGTTARVSVSTGGVQGNEGSWRAVLSADGRFVAFFSRASNLVPGDTNGKDDVFVRDRRKGTTERVSLGPNGVQGNGWSFAPALSADGRFVAFWSLASNLVPGDTNGRDDVFVRDRWKGTTERVSLGPNGVQGNEDSYDPALSADGRFAAFASHASNLVPGDTNGAQDVFVRDRRKGTTERVSMSTGGVQGNEGSIGTALSADGRFAAFGSGASNLVPGDTNGRSDVFVRDRRKGTTERVSLGQKGVQGNAGSPHAALSADGRFVAFESEASNLVPGDTNGRDDVFVRDRWKGTTERVSLGPKGVQGNEDSWGAVLSADGRFAAFASYASNLVPGDTNGVWDVFVRTLMGRR